MTQPDYSDEIIHLCQLVGFALHHFSKVEESLAALYGTAASIPNIEVAFKAHDEIREFRYRLNSTDAVVRLWIAKMKDQAAAATLSEEWNALYRIIKGDSEDRNRIAHFTVVPEYRADGSVTWYVCPYFQIYSHISFYKNQDELAGLPPGIRKFDAKSMEAKAKRFLKTSKRIDKFIGGLLKHGAQIPQSA